MSSPAEQMHLLGVCAKAREARCDANACDADENGDKFLVRFDRTKPDSFERCWIEDMDEYVRSNASLGYQDGLPVNETDFLPVLKLFMDTEVFLLEYQGHVGLFEGDDLRYVQFELTSTYRPPTSHQQTEPVLNAWEDFIEALNEEARANGANGVSAGYQTGGYPWVWIWSQKALIDNAIQGIFIVFAIAFVVLNFATGNVVISIIAIFTVAGIVTSVMGLGVKGIQDWDFGVAESIVSVILVGFSMDYSLHLADSYIESERSSRMDRTQDSLTRLGISVTAGAITTLTSGLFLWGAILTFFTKFAFMITSTIITSFLWSMLFFPSMAMTFGPEGTFGDWSTLIAAMRGWCGKRGEGK